MACLTRHSPRGWGRLWLESLVTRNTLLPHRPQVSCNVHKTFLNNCHLKAPHPFFTPAWPSRVGPQPCLCRFCLYKSSLSLESSVDWRIPSTIRNLISVRYLSSHRPGDLSQKPILLKCQTARLCFELHGDNRLSHSWVVTFCEETRRLNWGSPAQPFDVSQHRCLICFLLTFHFYHFLTCFLLHCAARQITSGLIMNTASGVFMVWLNLRGSWELKESLEETCDSSLR